MAKLGIVHGNGLSSILTKFFTGSKAYHALWITDEYIYDMHLIRRRRNRNATMVMKYIFMIFHLLLRCI
jgi:hypothetical protein